MQNIVLKDSTNTDTTFTVVRQPGQQSAILQQIVAGAGINQTAYPRIEVSAPINKGVTAPRVSVAVPFGAVVDGNYVRNGVVNHNVNATLTATAPDKAKADAAAFAAGVLANPQIKALFTSGLLS